MVQGIKNTKSKEKQTVKEKKPKLEIEDESLKPTDEDSIKKVKKKGRKYKCSYCKKVFQIEKKFFNKKMDIMSQSLEKCNIEVPDEPKKHVESSKHCHSAQSQGNMNYALSSRVKYFPQIFDIDSFSDISE